MRARFKVESPSAVEMSLTVTMTVTEWETLRDKLEEIPTKNFNVNRLKQAITTLLADVRRMHWFDEDRDALS